MNSLFYDYFDSFVVVYIDDLLLFSKNEKDHITHLELLLSILKRHQLYVDKSKHKFMKDSVECLGFNVSNKGTSIDEKRVSAVRNWPKPKSVSEIWSFIALMQFFRRFIKTFSGIAHPLTNLTLNASGMHNGNSFCDATFETLNKRLISRPILISPNWTKPFRCHVDAIQTAVGGTLTQQDNKGLERVMAYYSKRLNSAEENYTSNDCELLGLVYSLKPFR